MSPSPKSVLGSFLFLSVCFIVLMSLLVYASVIDAVSPRIFALSALLLMLGLFIALAYRFKIAQATKGSEGSKPSLEHHPGQVNLSPRRLRISVFVMVLLLLSGLWFTRGGPLLPRLVGVAVNLLITTHFILLLRRAKKVGSA